jgi:hypothetical protein
MEIFEPVTSGVDGAVFTVVVDGVRIELPWVKYAQLRDGVLVLEAGSSGSGQAAITYLRDFTQAAWQVSPGAATAGGSGRGALGD